MLDFLHRPIYLVAAVLNSETHHLFCRWEAARIPKVKVVKVNKVKEQSVYMPQIPDVIKCPEKLLPLKQWEDSFLSDFSQLREVNIATLAFI